MAGSDVAAAPLWRIVAVTSFFQMFRGKIRDSVVELFSDMIGSDYCQKRACVLD